MMSIKDEHDAYATSANVIFAIRAFAAPGGSPPGDDPEAPPFSPTAVEETGAIDLCVCATARHTFKRPVIEPRVEREGAASGFGSRILSVRFV